MGIVHSGGHSTKVRLRLEVDGQTLRVAQVGDNWLVVKDQFTVCPTDDANLLISIDDRVTVYPISLPNGITGREVIFTDRDCCRTSFGDGASLPF